MQYYVIQVLTTGEDDFVRKVRVLHPELQFIVPKRTLMIRKAGKNKAKTAPVFSGYVFLEIETFVPGGDEYWAIRTTPGFFRYLRDNSMPTELTEDDRRLVLHFATFSGKESISKVFFDDNDRIVVKEGPLKGYEGKIVKVDRRKGRAKIVLDLYDTSFPIDMGFELVEKTGNASNVADQTMRNPELA
jgi:transcriptional antiterminator NusG